MRRLALPTPARAAGYELPLPVQRVAGSIRARPWLWLYMLAGVLSLALGWLTLRPPRTLVVNVGTDGNDRAYIRGFFHRERADEYRYRWLSGDAAVVLPAGKVGDLALLRATFHGAPQASGQPLPVTFSAGPHQFELAIPPAHRNYKLLLPTDAMPAGRLNLSVRSVAVVAPGDNRPIAIGLNRVSIQPLDQAGRPAMTLLFAQSGLLLAFLALLHANRAAWRTAVLAAGGGLLLLVWLNLNQRLWIGAAAAPFALALAVLAAASLGLQRRLPQWYARYGAGNATAGWNLAGWRWIWAIGLTGLALRVLGVLAPGFEANDLDIQSKHFGQVAGGLTFLTVSSHEWAGGKTFYPSGPYVLMLPLLLVLPSLPLALHLGIAMLDALAAPLLALLTRQLGASRPAALLAAALMAGLPIHFTAIWWGFSTNIGGQVALILLVWLAIRFTARPTRRNAWLLFVGLLLLLLTHVGVIIQTGVMVAFALSMALLSVRRRPLPWRGLLLVFGSGAALFTLFYLLPVIGPFLAHADNVFGDPNRIPPDKLAADRAYIIGIVPVAFWRGMAMIPLLLLIPGLALLWSRMRAPLGRELLAGWLFSSVLFYIIDVVYIVQVRYVFFIAPLCCLGAAVVLARLGQSRAGRVTATAAALLVIALGLILWYRGAVLGIKASLVPLTH